jgi:DNA-binding NarL/FixJ family response regulator
MTKPVLSTPVLRTRVALADDQELVREGLKALLTRLGIDVVVEAPDGASLLSQLATTVVDVIVSDIRMPGLGGVDMVRELRRRGDSTPVVLLTTFDDSELMLAAVNAGAQAFLLKDASPDDLRNAVEHVKQGSNWLAPVATDPVRERIAYREASAPDAAFGERELSILRLLTGGYSNKEIARSLNLAEGTVKNYISEILAKLGTRDRTRAVLKAITLRIV